MARRQIVLLIILFISVFTVSFVGSTIFFTARNAYKEIVVTAPPPKLVASPTPTPDPLSPFGILLLGYRGDGSRGGTLTDTMMVAYVDQRAEQVTLISVPRDLWVSLPTEGNIKHNFKINAAYAIGMDDRNYPNKQDQFKGLSGGGVMSKTIVEEVTGLPIRYFASVNFDAFKKTIDTLGGIDVHVSSALVDPFFPIVGKEDELCDKPQEEIDALTATLSGQLLEEAFTCRFEEVKVDPGIVHMDSELALKFARSRHAKTGGSDFSRSNRQKEILLAVRDKVLSTGVITRAVPFIQTLSGSLRTDIGISVIQSYLGQVGEFKSYTVKSLALSTSNILKEDYSTDGQYILVPNEGDGWEAVHSYLEEELSK